MVALRIPTAMGLGVLVSIGLFSLLASLVNGPLDVTEAIKIAPPVFTRVSALTPVAPPVRPPMPDRPPPPTNPTGPGLRDPEIVRPGRGERIVFPTFGAEIAPETTGIGIDHDPQPVVRVNPNYPARAVQHEMEGWVEVQFSVTATGAVKDVVIVDSHPQNIFDEAVLKAVGRWRYNPKVDAGVAVERIGMRTRILFDLDRAQAR